MYQKISVLFFIIISQLALGQVDFKRVNAEILIDTLQHSVSGNVDYHFEVIKPLDSIIIDAQNMSFYDVLVDGKNIGYKVTNRHLILVEEVGKGAHQLTFEYHAVPTKAMYFIGWGKRNDNESQIWTQGQGKYTSNWFPSFDDENEKLIFNLSIQFDEDYQVISNGVLVSKKKEFDKWIWEYRMNEPMSSYLLMLAIGKYEKKVLISEKGVPLELYYELKDSLKVEPTYRYSKEIFDFFEEEIGYDYPWDIYRQIPVHDFVYAGMENTSSTIFSHEFVVDSIGFNDQNYVNINAHELAHQWFGNIVTASESKHHWLHEGFATFYALLAEKEVFGEEYFYWELYKYATELQEAAKFDNVPLLDGKASSLTFYKKGALALYWIYLQLGRENFNVGVLNYLNKYSFESVTTEKFLKEMCAVGKLDAKEFRRVWLVSSEFPEQLIYEMLFESDFINKYVRVQELRLAPFKEKRIYLEKLMNSEEYFPIKQEVIYQLETVGYQEKKKIIEDAIDQQIPQLDLVISAITTTIGDDYRPVFEKLLSSTSYKARELALVKLWSQYPEYASLYLEQTKGVTGLSNKNLELQWLYLSILTRGYDKIDLGVEVSKLLDYTTPKNDVIVRQSALAYCLKLQLINYTTVRSLIQGTTHPRWQFAKYSKNQLRKLMLDKTVQKAIWGMREDLVEKELNQVDALWKELRLTKVE